MPSGGWQATGRAGKLTDPHLAEFMNLRRCLRIAERLRLPFEQQVGIAIDVQRMVSDSSYVLDVLTVCEARPDSPLMALAQQFRLALAEPPAADEADAQGADTTGWGSSSTSFGATQNQPVNSVFEQARQAARAARRSPTWMRPGRWLGSDS